MNKPMQAYCQNKNKYKKIKETLQIDMHISNIGQIILFRKSGCLMWDCNNHYMQGRKVNSYKCNWTVLFLASDHLVEKFFAIFCAMGKNFKGPF